MNFTIQFLHLPVFVFFLIVISISAMAGISATYLGRNYLRKHIPASHNEFTGPMFGVIAGLYGLILAFVIFFVWQQLDDAQKIADTEGSLTMEIYQDIRYYPDAAKRTELKSTIRNYVQLVVNKEYPLMANGYKSPETSTAFDRLCDQIGRLRVTNRGSRQDQIDPFSQNLLNDHLLKKLNELTTYRNLRLLSGGSDIPIAVWVPLIFGGIITLIFSIMIVVDDSRVHYIVNGLLGSFIGLIFYLIITIDHPFSGAISIKPSTYTEVLLKFRTDKF